MDYSKWIYSEDIAAWLSAETVLSPEEQAVCICAAPHRTIAEKLEGIRELNAQNRNGHLEGRIKALEVLMQRVYSDVPIEQYLYGAEIYWCGEKEWFQPEMLYRTVKDAIQDIRKRIEDISIKTERKKENFYGVAPVFYARALQEYRLVENLAIRHDGEIIYCQPDSDNEGKIDYISPEPFNAMRIPFFSGTIVEIEESPFMPPLKGVLVNMEAEPDEDGFKEFNAFYQWLIYPEYEKSQITHGIGIAALRDDYPPFLAGNSDIVFPYRQFVRKCNKIKENELWMEELGKLVKADKRCIGHILEDRHPRKRVNMNEERLKYIRRFHAQV